MRTTPWRVVLSGLTLVAASACGGSGARTAPTDATAASTAAAATTSAAATTTTARPPTSPAPPTTVAAAPAAAGDAIGACEAPSGAGVAVGAFGLADGAPTWRACSSTEASRAVLGATDDTVYVESTERDGPTTMTALDARTGAVRWSRTVVRTIWGWPAGPIAGAGVVVLTVAADPGSAPAVAADPFGPTTVVGVDAMTGEERWRLDAAGRTITPTTAAAPVVGPPNNGPGAGPGAPIAATPTMAVLAAIAGAVGVDRATGVIVWSLSLLVQDTAGTGVARSPAAVAGETVLLPATDRDGAGPVAVDARTGSVLWRTGTLDHPSATDDVAVGYDSRGGGPANALVIAVSMRDGSVRWSQPGMPSYGDLWALGDGVAVVRTMDAVVAYDLATGAERWRRAGGPDLGGEPQLVTGGLVVLLWEGDVAVLSAADGRTVWSSKQPLASSRMSAVATNDTTLFVSVNTVEWGD